MVAVTSLDLLIDPLRDGNWVGRTKEYELKSVCLRWCVRRSVADPHVGEKNMWMCWQVKPWTLFVLKHVASCMCQHEKRVCVCVCDERLMSDSAERSSSLPHTCLQAFPAWYLWRGSFELSKWCSKCETTAVNRKESFQWSDLWLCLSKTN